jgi:hypothetical protein
MVRIIIYILTFLGFWITLPTAHASIYYADPINGSMQNDGSIENPWSTIQEIIELELFNSKAYDPLPYNPDESILIIRNPNAIIQPGDTLMLMNGLHGEAAWRNFNNDKPITVMAYPNHEPQISWVGLYACRNWIFENLQISSEPYGHYQHRYLVHVESNGFFGPSSLVSFKDCRIYSTENPWSTANEWIDNASEGMYLRADSLTAIGNTIMNTSFGLTATGNHILAHDNEIINFSADGMRIIGSNITFSNNLIKNCYDVDDNHDDGIQAWAEINGVVSDHNQVIGNTIINSDDYDRPLVGPLQGIGCFDGMYNDWLVANNVVSVNHWHGITFLGANRCTIIHNTVLDPTPLVIPGASWIEIADHKDGRPSSDCLVANNVCNRLMVDGNLSNNLILENTEEYEIEFEDHTINNFRLNENSILINAADILYSLDKDIEGNDRLFNGPPDIGAYEYQGSLTSIKPIDKKDLLLYPNPFRNKIILKSEENITSIVIFDMGGHKIAQGNIDYINSILNDMPSGVLIFQLFNTNGTSYHQKMTKL